MDKFLKRKSTTVQDSSPTQEIGGDKQSRINLNNLPSDPGLRKRISTYHPNDQDATRSAYFQRGPCQPLSHNFPQKDIGGVSRRFNLGWFKEFGIG